MYRLALLCYNLLFPLLFMLYWPWYRRKLRRRGEYREGFGERFGRYAADKAERLAAVRRPIWLHAVSVGELNVALGLLAAWRAREPGRDFVISTTTNTAQALARAKAPPEVPVIYAPLDCQPWVNAALEQVAPAALVILEVELWPTWLHQARRRGLPVALVNARVSDRSARGLRRHRWFFQRVLAHFTQIAAQTPADAERLRAVGGETLPVRVLGNLKFDQVASRERRPVTPWLTAAFGPGPGRVLCGASTWPGEEAALWRAWCALRVDFPDLRLVLVPRHAERASAILAEAQAAAIAMVTLTDLRATIAAGTPPAPGSPDCVLLANTTGELVDFLAASSLVVVGKSFAGNAGGQNPIEPAQLTRPVLFGPAMDNFRDLARLMLERGAARQIHDDASLQATLRELLADDAARERLGQAGLALVREQQGATTRTLDWLLAEWPAPERPAVQPDAASSSPV